MNLSAIVQRLQTEIPIGTFRQIGSAADLDAALDGTPSAPACYVIPQAEDAEDNDIIDGVEQQVNIEFGIIIVAAARRNTRLGNAADGDELQDLRDAVRAALLGHIPTGAAWPITFSGGRLIEFQPGFVWWQDAYRTAHFITS